VPWGLTHGAIDTDTWTAEITPRRRAEVDVDVVTFLHPPKGQLSNLKILVTDAVDWLTTGEITVEVSLTHPFPGLNEYTGHDVKGVLIGSGSITGLSDDTVKYSDGVNDTALLNADGYTRWMNPSEFEPNGTFFRFVPGALGDKDLGVFNATINPYKYFADQIDKTEGVSDFFSNPNNVAHRGQFTAGYQNTREYKLKFPIVGGIPDLVFQYAVIAHWMEPDNYDPGDLPGSFPPSANADEAIFARIVSDDSSLWYEDGVGGGGDIKLGLEVYDWGGAFNPSGVPGEIGSVILESQTGLIPGGYAEIPGNILIPTAQPGSTLNSSVVTVEIPACTPTGLEAGDLLITITSADPTSFDVGFGDPPTDAPLASYFFYGDLEVSGQAPYIEPVTDLSLILTRIASGTSFENIELHWTDTNAAEYVVYADNDPYDNGGVIDIDYTTEIALVSGSPAILSSFDHNGAYVYTVRARSTAGDPGSESDDSNYALIEMDDGGSASDPGNWIMGGNSIYYGQMRMSRGATSGNNGWGYFVDNGLYANACMVMWSTLCTPAIPEFSTATEAYIEWAHNYYDCWKAATFSSCNYPDNYPGFTGGGATAPPPAPVGYADPSLTWMEYDIFYNTPDDPPGGVGDPATHLDYNNISIYGIFGNPTKSAIWHGTNTNWLVSRVNVGLADSAIDYAAVTCSCYTSLNNWTANEGHYYMDDLAVIVY
ncbi:MAG: hypothetical protein ABIC40_04260, partial [bacterium]